MLNEIESDLLLIDTKYIAHQCNVLSADAGGIAASIFLKYPYSNCYQYRKGCSRKELPLAGQEPGNILICGSGEPDERFIINMFSQFYPGSYNNNYIIDSETTRLNYFKSCLEKIKEIPDLTSIAFPYKIGCNLGGGNWEKYYSLLRRFAEDLEFEADVYICRRKGD